MSHFHPDYQDTPHAERSDRRAASLLSPEVTVRAAQGGIVGLSVGIAAAASMALFTPNRPDGIVAFDGGFGFLAGALLGGVLGLLTGNGSSVRLGRTAPGAASPLIPSRVTAPAAHIRNRLRKRRYRSHSFSHHTSH